MPPPLSQIVFDRTPPGSPEISFLVPVYNERASILDILSVLERFPRPQQIIVVDDGSTDGTRDILSQCRSPILLAFHEKNGGKGAAIQTALAQARGAHTAVQDADLEYDPLEYLSLLEKARAEKLDVVFGSRFLIPNPNLYKRYLWGNKLMTGWINTLCGTRYTDTYTCYKLMKTDVFRGLNLSSRGFEMEAEIAVKTACRGHAWAEAPIHYKPRKLEEGKKIGWKDAWRGAKAAWRFWLEETRVKKPARIKA